MEDQDFSSCAKTADGKPWNMKITSWNINGIRAWVKVGSLSYKRVIPCVSIALLSTSVRHNEFGIITTQGSGMNG